MVRNFSSPCRQRGVSVIELPAIVLIVMLIVVFVVKINHGMSMKAKLNRLSYSLVSVVTSDRLGILLTGDKDVVTPELAESLHHVVMRRFQSVLVSSDVETGVLLEQLKFDGKGQVESFHHVSAGTPCHPKQALAKLPRLSPVGSLLGVNKGLRPDLFQVTVCLTGIPFLNGDFSTVLTRNFTERYFTSSAVLIGRQL